MITIPFVYYWIGGIISVLALISLFYISYYTKKDLKT
jgi:hypothetical protein